VLELKDIYFTIEKNDEEVHLIEDASLKVHSGHFMAIVGPSGCGKTTLLKVIAGLNVESKGHVFWNGRDLSEEGDLEPSEIGYVPQFSIAYELLTVEESIRSAIRLRVRIRMGEFSDLLEKILEDTGLTSLRGRPVRVLSGGQRRRLSLALELVTNPVLLLCDEVTSGLDPKSEQEIVKLLHQLSRTSGRIVVNVTHSLANLDLYDSVLVLHEGRVVYHGQPRALEHYFSVTIAEDIYPRLAKRESSDWGESWKKHGEEYYKALDSAYQVATHANTVNIIQGEDMDSSLTPGVLIQFIVLLFRRFKLFLRDGSQWILQLAMLLGFPMLVVIFALDGIEPIKQLSETIAANPIEEAQQQADAFKSHLKTGGLISGLIMFQVILLTLMASNNSAREIAGERQIYEKERFGGLNPLSYLASKVVYLGVMVVVQSLWMAIFVHSICHLPTADFGMHLTLLLLVNAAMTAICLGISAISKSAEQSSLLSVYLVGFQLPLSGAVLALPAIGEWLTRPFISAYWAWSGGVSALNSDAKSAVDTVIETSIQPSWLCVLVLSIHFAIGLFVAYVGVKKNRCL